MFQHLQPTSAAASYQSVELPTNVDSGSEFCTRMQFKVTPAYRSACGPSVQVREQLTPSGAPGLQAVEVCNAVAGFEPETNTIAVFRSGWRHQPSLQCPVQADGVYCLSKLEWLAHTLAHEMVHCIVHNCCPESRQYAAYTHDNGHGPIFLRLNSGEIYSAQSQNRDREKLHCGALATFVTTSALAGKLAKAN
eukprot:gene7722-7921_t